MKKIYLYLLAGTVMLLLLSSCISSRKDCQGVRHQKLKNGIII